ncbi:hypothetical protein [Pseudoduganella namucuonensis]|uniref:Uncharacterized protein n=1 Tax=Pseudoduganella namucuonensis TaxID=1035707 RepID=A0A1I7K942_9BURK|nr:hypothetical protein [Pseudoduganella namucuonensis]SFU93954.1 hypothetical protein SAMN05216552_1015123 [Pseudoduganella namucuonensis]
MQSTADFFTNTPLPHCMDGWRGESQARLERQVRWAGHEIVGVNGRLVWKRRADIQPDDMRVFYDGDYRDVLAPDDPRIVIPCAECTDLPAWPVRLDWDE